MTAWLPPALRRTRRAIALLCLALSGATHAAAFPDWLAGFRATALRQGVSAATLDAALAGAEPLDRVIELDRRQPEFLTPFDDYLGRRITPRQVARGQALLAEHAALFDAVEARYGVPKTVLAAFWGLESHYGANLGGFNVPRALATLAWDGRRSAFFQRELIEALRIVDAGHVAAPAMLGSWAGAMGQMQFMPSTFRAHAVDGDGDGRIDLWNSLPDALYSAARYLSRAGWRTGEPIAVEALLPPEFDWKQARAAHRLPLSDWRAMGVSAATGELPRVAGRAAIVLPQGWRGPAFMVFDNFDVGMDWNRSVHYVLAVAQLASELGGGPGLMRIGGEPGALSTTQVAAMQQALAELGIDAGQADGLIGPKTQNALRRFQHRHGLPVDGYPAPSVFEAVAAAHARARAAGALHPASPALPAPFFATPEN